MTQLALGESDQIKLTSKDVLNIVQIPDWYESNVVTLSGEVIFPGTYQISNGETLKSLLKRAGGLTKEATIEAAVFTRIELQKKEQSTIKQAVEDLREQLANNNLSNSQFSKIIDYDNATKVLNDLENTKPIGRLVIDLNGLLNGQMLRDIELKGGDNLVIPNITPAVSVIGEVFVTATHWYDPTLSIADYISKAGGVREYGDASKVYIVKADGSVFIPESSFWFTTSNKVNLTPGDTIVVPRDVTNYDNISLWQGVTQIVYQSAVALAAIGSL
jgi:protein involved in polysaccharide export with SLBB domain